MERYVLIIALLALGLIGQQSVSADLSLSELQECAKEAEDMLDGFYVPEEVNQLETQLRSYYPGSEGMSVLELLVDHDQDKIIEPGYEADWAEVMYDFGSQLHSQLSDTKCGAELTELEPFGPEYKEVVASKHKTLDRLIGLAHLALYTVQNHAKDGESSF